MISRRMLVLSTAFALLGLPDRQAAGEGLEPLRRSPLEWRRFRAKSLGELLLVADAFARAQLPGEAKLTVDQAAKLATTPGDWNSIAVAYK